MRTRRHLLLGIGLVVAAALLASLILAFWLVRRSFPVTSGSLAVSGLSAPVEVRRDAYGMPHIRARSDLDAYEAVGYIHAQDRLWQMDLIRRVGQGRLAEVFGASALPVDRLFRTLGLWNVAGSIEDSLDGQTRAALEAYARGVNAYIASNRGRLPVEFDMLNAEPEVWTVRHSLLVSRLMAWELDYSRWMDILMGVFVERFGEERARVLFPQWDEGAPVIVPGGHRVRATGLRAFLDAEQEARRVLGMTSLGHGSNAWAVSGARTASGKPLLANDPHLLLFTPARFYELHMTAPGVEVSGFSIPGVPFVIIGRNRSIAWGLTNAMMDDHDFYTERVDSVLHPTSYLLDGRWVPLRIREDTILVKNSDPVLLTVYSTHRGPIVNRFEASARWSRELLSMRWTGLEPANDARTFLLINNAASWGEFLEATSWFTAPAQNFLYADTAGHIGYHTGGRLPIRPVARNAVVPSDGTDSRNDWKGFLPPSALPTLLDPVQGFIVTANNKIADASYPHEISNLWEPSWRARRINEVLSETERAGVEEMQRLQQDVLSPFARSTVPIILSAFPDSLVRPELAQALTYLRTWDYTMRREDVATTIFETTILRMVKETFEDEMGPELLAVYDTVAGMPLTALERLLRTPDSPWFDDVRTPAIESRDDIIRRSLSAARNDLRGMLGVDLKTWRWERVHDVVFEHVFGANAMLAPIFNNGPYQVPGSHSTVSVGYYVLTQPYRMTVGSSIRVVFDLGDVNATRSVLPPGQSGQVFHRNYNDQIGLWLHGAYRIVPMDSVLVARSATSRLVLEPSRP